MASYEAGIKVLVDAQQALAAIKKVEDKLKTVQDTAQAKKVKVKVEEATKQVTQKERELSKQIDLNAATDLYNRRLQQINRAGGARNAAQRKELAGLQKIVDTQGNSLLLVRKSATALGRILEVIRETNRTDKRSNELQRQVRAYQTQFDLLREQGVAESKLNKAIELRDKLSEQQAKKQLDIAAITKDQLDQKLRLLKAEVDQKRAVEQTAAAEKQKAQQQGLGLRNLAGRFTPVINRTARLAAPKRQLALPSTEMLAPKRKGLERLKQVETSSERVARFVVVTARAYERSAERSKSILADNNKAVRQAERRAKAAEREARSTERTAKAVKTVAKTSRKSGSTANKRSTRNNAGAIAGSIGFPLLFGGGPGSILGAGIGAAIGGFPGGILGSALGQGVDDTVVKLVEFASAISSATISLEELINAAGLRGTTTATDIKFSEFLGVPELGREAGNRQVEAVVGKEGVENLKDLSDKSKDLSNAFSKLLLRLGSFSAPFLSGAIGVLGIKSPEDRKTQLESQATTLRNNIAQFEKDGVTAGLGFSKKQLAEIERQLESINDQSTVSTDLNEELNGVVNARVNLLKDGVSLEQNRLSLRRDDLAFQEAGLELARARNQLDEINLRLNKESIGADAKRQLEFEKSITEERVNQLEAAQDNAVLLAQVQLQKELLALENQINSVFKNRLQKAFDFVKLTTDQKNTYKAKLVLIGKQFEKNKAIIENERDSALLLVNEEEKRKKILALAKEKLTLAEEEKRNNEEIARQNEVFRLDAEQAFRDQLELARLARTNQAFVQSQNTDPERRFSFAGEGLGFFAESSLFESNRIEESALKLQEYNVAIANLQNRLVKLKNENVEDARIVPTERELERLTQLRDDFQKFQPILDQNAISAARYADALNAVTPGVTSLVSGLQEVVAGTKSAQEAFADFLRTIADQLMQTAATMIAQYAAIAIARMFAIPGSGGGLSGGLGGLSPTSNVPFNGSMPFTGFADGGFAQPGRSYIVGERGPELLTMSASGGYVTNNSASQAAMDRYSGGNSRGGAISVNYNVTEINGMKFVTEDQFRAGISQAAKQGADGGFNRTMSSLKNSRSTRSRVGV